MSPVDEGADRRQRLAAAARRAPGFRLASDRVLPRLRANRTLTDLVWRVFDPDHGLGVARRPFRSAGADPDAELLPVVAFVLLGADDATFARALDAVCALRDETGAFRPVLVVDRPDLGAVRGRGLVVDHVVPRDAWTGDAADHDAYVGRRLVSVVDGFRTWHLVHLGPDGEVPAADARLLRAVRPAIESGRTAGRFR
ncbi:hypothetical protein [Arthrobacter sp. NEB 688]|uniref:hypothetical protein n=1 Tax=Arthrobacter sp. NEB 688 TaxID=904039 RepID=UPI001566375B|nr:hypothetical protein [Arthrobacter sp. NEB 688]QKE85537.1 hypothetical protein HL663_17470 [Arthrobacter sp. NEB 688]